MNEIINHGETRIEIIHNENYNCRKIINELILFMGGD